MATSKRKTKKPAVKKSVRVNPRARKTEHPLQGRRAPDFTVSTDEGRPVSLRDFRGKQVVLYFYPKDDTPGCTREACDFRDSWRRVTARGAIVLGVSRDSVESHRKFKDKYKLPYPLLADEKGKICESFGVWKKKQNYGRTYMGIERTTFVIDKDGKVAKVFPRVRVDGHVDQVLSELK